jgi:hypothetical protein
VGNFFVKCVCLALLSLEYYTQYLNNKIRSDYDLADFIKIYAQENRTTASEVITQFVLGLKRRTSGQHTETILSDPKFSRTLTETHERIKDGSAQWHTFDEVFSDYVLAEELLAAYRKTS